MQVVGTCAFTRMPQETGRVEIAYTTFSMFEGLGFGTAMARSLIEIARGAGTATHVIAYTLPESSASTTILGKIGMTWRGEVTIEDEGMVWLWELSLKRDGRNSSS